VVARDEWETGKKLAHIFSPIDGNVLGFPHYRLHRDNISATGPKLPDGTTAQPGMAEAIEIQRQAGHSIYADQLSAMLYGAAQPRAFVRCATRKGNYANHSLECGSDDDNGTYANVHETESAAYRA